MDHRFLEFYGRYLLNAAQTQKQIEKASDWINKGFKSFEGMEEIFKTCYGIPGSQKEAGHGSEKYKEAMDAFQSSFSNYVKQMGWVMAKDHDELKNEYEKLQKKVEEQQKIIDQLSHMLGIRSGMGYEEFFKQIQNLGKEQTNQFKDLMQAFQQAFDTTDKTSD